MIPQEQINNFYSSLISSITSEVEKRILKRLKSTTQAEDELLKPEAVAKYLDVHKTTVYELCKERQLKHVRVGSIRSKQPAIRIPKSALDEYIQKNLEEVKP